MRFKTLKCLVAQRLKQLGIFRLMLPCNPGRGDPFNRLSWKLVKGELFVADTAEAKQEHRRGRVIGECPPVKLLAYRGTVKPDAVVSRTPASVRLDDVRYSYPEFLVDMSLFSRLTLREKRSLVVQLGMAYGVVKDYFTPECFAVSCADSGVKEFLNLYFSPSPPFRCLAGPPEGKVVVLDPSGEEEFSHEEVDENTTIVVGGVVDTGGRLKGVTAELFPDAVHRRISFHGEVDIVPDRINQIIRIVCEYLTSERSLNEVVAQFLTRDSKLRWLRGKLQKTMVRFLLDRTLIRGVPEDTVREWMETYQISDFLLRKASRHVGGFMVFRPSIFSRVKGETRRRGMRVLILSELGEEDVTAFYP